MREWTLVAYLSSHGFGHAVRAMEVLRALRQLQPALSLHLRTMVPHWFVRHGLGNSVMHVPVLLDVGVVQADSLTVDIGATLQAQTALTLARDRILNDELAALRRIKPRLIFSDIPALACDLGAHLGIPVVAMGNFSWDWIYADYARDVPQFAPLVTDLATSYGRADLLLRLPFHGGLDAFKRRQDIGLVTRRPTVATREVRLRLGVPAHDVLVVLSFGGVGLGLTTAPRRRLGVTYVATQSAAPVGAPPHGYRFVTNSALIDLGVRYEDLIAAADAVVTKPGYGIIADCIAGETPIVYTSRGRFAEYACLVTAIHQYLPNAFVSNDDLRTGRWDEALDLALSAPVPSASIDLNGAAIAAQNLHEILLGN